MTRRNVFTALAAAPAVIAAAAKAPVRSAKTRFLKPQRVCQAEIEEILDLHDRAEILAAGIRRRLEAGADFEGGKWGLDSSGYMSLSWYEEHGLGKLGDYGGIEVVGLMIEPANNLREHREKFPEDAHEIWA